MQKEVFAPAFAGPRHESKKYPWWREEARPAHIKEITKTKFIDALVFAYKDDDFNRPEELKFLTELYLNNVNLIGYNCKKGHLTHAKDCKYSETEILILKYVNDQINSKKKYLFNKIIIYKHREYFKMHQTLIFQFIFNILCEIFVVLLR